MTEGTYVAPEAAPEPKSNRTLWIILAVVVGLLLICCCCIAAFFLFGGPIFGEVFSNVLETIEITPVY
jgi:flagellar basal body-associated protein FliL